MTDEEDLLYEYPVQILFLSIGNYSEVQKDIFSSSFNLNSMR